jgi:hypothetical protein
MDYHLICSKVNCHRHSYKLPVHMYNGNMSCFKPCYSVGGSDNLCCFQCHVNCTSIDKKSFRFAMQKRIFDKEINNVIQRTM